MTSAPVRLCFFTVRVSRGVSALGPVSSLGLGPAPSSRLAANPGNEIEIRLSCFCFPTLRQRAPVPASFRLIVTDSSSGVFFSGMSPTETGDPRVSRRAAIASANRLRTRGLVGPTHARDDLPLTLLSRFPLRYRDVPFAVHVGRFGETRRDRFHPAAVTRRSFSRSRAPSFDGRCAALLPLSRAAIAHPVPRGFALRELLLGSRAVLLGPPGPALRGVAHPACRESVFVSPTAPSTTIDVAVKSLVRLARAAWNSGLD